MRMILHASGLFFRVGKNSQTNNKTNDSYSSYAYNAWWDWDSNANYRGVSGQAAASIGNPSGLITAVDGAMNYVGSNDTYKRVHLRHSKGLNVAWTDGHATWETTVFFNKNAKNEKFWCKGYDQL